MNEVNKMTAPLYENWGSRRMEGTPSRKGCVAKLFLASEQDLD